jgi:hypothetical protein
LISGNSGSGTYNLYGGTLRANINLGSPGGVLRQTGGSLISGTVSANFGSVVGVEGGDFETTDLAVGRVGGGAFNVSGGTARVLGTLSVDGHSTSRLLETGGSLVVGKLTVGSAMTAGSVTLQGGSLEAASIVVYNGSFTQTAGTLKAASLLVSGGAVMLGGTQNWANASTLTATRGTLTLASDAGSAAAANLGVDIAGATTTLRGVQHFRALHVGSGSVASGDLLVTRSLKVDGTGRFDLARGALVVDYAAGAVSPLGDVTASILAARGTGSWDGPGITSSAAAGMADVAVGYAEAVDVLGASGGMFLGEAVEPTAVLVRVTRAGDANLNGTVEFGDLLSLARHYNTDVAAPGGAWVAGDFTYDGLINFTDLLVLARNYNSTAPLGEVPGASASLKADLAAAFAQVPEPATGALVGAGICWRCMRRARRR